MRSLRFLLFASLGASSLDNLSLTFTFFYRFSELFCFLSRGLSTDFWFSWVPEEKYFESDGSLSLSVPRDLFFISL